MIDHGSNPLMTETGDSRHLSHTRCAATFRSLYQQYCNGHFHKGLYGPFTIPICGTVNQDHYPERAGSYTRHACVPKSVFPRFKGSHAMRKCSLEGGLRVVSTLLRNRLGSRGIPRISRSSCTGQMRRKRSYCHTFRATSDVSTLLDCSRSNVTERYRCRSLMQNNVNAV